MRVSIKSAGTTGSQSLGGVAPATPSASPAPAAPAPASDALSVSSTAQFVAVARAHLAGVPDVRTEKVEALRAQLDSDSYHPDPTAVADGLVREYSPQHQGG